MQTLTANVIISDGTVQTLVDEFYKEEYYIG